MAIPAFRVAVASIALFLATMLVCPRVHAQASDGRDKPTAAFGLGESMPSAPDLSSDPAWQIYKFERDGIRYLQINDTAYNARAAVGQIGSTAWVLPIGSDADRVAVQSAAQLPSGARVVYQDAEIEVVHYLQSGQDRWIVRPAAAAY